LLWIFGDQRFHSTNYHVSISENAKPEIYAKHISAAVLQSMQKGKS
jgi:hypothetical protein